MISTLTSPVESQEEPICLVFAQQCFESTLTWLEQDVLTPLSGPNMHECTGQGEDASSNLIISRSSGIMQKDESFLIKLSASSLLSSRLLMLRPLILSRMASYSRDWIMSKETSLSSTEKGKDPPAYLHFPFSMLHYLFNILCIKCQKSLTTWKDMSHEASLFLLSVLLLNRSKKTGIDSAELSITEKNKAIEDGQNNNVEPAVYLSG